MLMIMVVMFILISGMWIFSSKREHLLSALLSLEYMSMGVYLLFLFMLSNLDLYYSLVFITFTACEGALGLSILVMMSRTHGGDYFKSFNLI
uniref:NADH-ubiquinone oxidoreductase chain 4L n=1 Tax=Cryptopygus terranovus TaxID=1906390 RepID=A0A343AYR8_9HEXA|nr:NADH dehydrogenase subunit 4L [Cryptopygus terranovus]APX54990.1 NADH dehydrogenase subunit 4L [Cryptopygus terranovus]